jgi:DNA-binding HxlR family transcriptional regulator
MMCAIATRSRGVAQAELRTLLGVTKATIYRMLRSLEDLGLVVRTPHPKNPRHRWVAITIAGLYRLGETQADVVDTGELAWATEEIVNPKPGNHVEGAIAIRETDTLFNRMRQMLADYATLRFPYDGEYA